MKFVMGVKKMNDRIKKKKNKEAFLARGERIKQKEYGELANFIAFCEDVNDCVYSFQHAVKALADSIRDCAGSLRFMLNGNANDERSIR